MPHFGYCYLARLSGAKKAKIGGEQEKSCVEESHEQDNEFTPKIESPPGEWRTLAVAARRT